MTKVLVTGANGFIGSNLVRRLLSEGFAVNSLVRKSSDLRFLEGLDTTLFYGDINQASSLAAPLEGVKKVYHVAGLAADWGPYSRFEQVNLQGTINVAKAAESADIQKLIYISTVAFHGFGKANITEEQPPAKKLIPYAKTKYLAEKWLFEFDKTSKLNITAIRPGNVYGVNDRTFMAKYIDAIETGKFAEINKGRSKTCPVYIDNLVDILLLVGQEEKANGHVFLATDGLDITWHTFNTALAQALGKPLPKASMPYGVAMFAAHIYYGIHKALQLKSEPFLTPYRINNGGKDYHFSIQKLELFFGYKPQIDVQEGLRRTVNWYKNQ